MENFHPKFEQNQNGNGTTNGRKSQEIKPQKERVEGKTHRVQLDFSAEAYEKLNELKEHLHVSSSAEVIRDGLGMIQLAINHKEKGDKILIEREDGSQAEVIFSFFPPDESSEK